jgi:hypothetical protein
MPSVRCPNTSSRTMAKGSTQSLAEISARNLPAGKSDRLLRWITSLLSVWRFWGTRCLKIPLASTNCAGIALAFSSMNYIYTGWNVSTAIASFFFLVSWKSIFGATIPQGIIIREDRSLQWYLCSCLRIFASIIKFWPPITLQYSHSFISILN